MTHLTNTKEKGYRLRLWTHFFLLPCSSAISCDGAPTRKPTRRTHRWERTPNWDSPGRRGRRQQPKKVSHRKLAKQKSFPSHVASKEDWGNSAAPHRAGDFECFSKGSKANAYRLNPPYAWDHHHIPLLLGHGRNYTCSEEGASVAHLGFLEHVVKIVV